MDLALFDYTLPRRLIAQRPLSLRSQSRMLVLENKHIWHRKFTDFGAVLRPGDVVALNNSRVVAARYTGRRQTGASLGILLVKELSPNSFECLVKGKLMPGETFLLGTTKARAITADSGRATIEVESLQGLKGCGQVPLPPYIKCALSDSDEYQTVYARHPGSVAAPTAGFHFTEEVLQGITDMGARLAYITLHVAPGTFLPVREADVSKHRMHPESYTITKECAAILNKRKGRLFVVGTTTLRAMESACTGSGKVRPGTGETSLFVIPGYAFLLRFEYLLTNFHLPKSTVLMLACAVGGISRVMSAYRKAVAEEYRFGSFGDCMLIRNQAKGFQPSGHPLPCQSPGQPQQGHQKSG